MSGKLVIDFLKNGAKSFFKTGFKLWDNPLKDAIPIIEKKFKKELASQGKVDWESLHIYVVEVKTKANLKRLSWTEPLTEYKSLLKSEGCNLLLTKTEQECDDDGGNGGGAPPPPAPDSKDASSDKRAAAATAPPPSPRPEGRGGGEKKSQSSKGQPSTPKGGADALPSSPKSSATPTAATSSVVDFFGPPPPQDKGKAAEGAPSPAAAKPPASPPPNRTTFAPVQSAPPSKGRTTFAPRGATSSVPASRAAPAPLILRSKTASPKERQASTSSPPVDPPPLLQLSQPEPSRRSGDGPMPVYTAEGVVYHHPLPGDPIAYRFPTRKKYLHKDDLPYEPSKEEILRIAEVQERVKVKRREHAAAAREDSAARARRRQAAEEEARRRKAEKLERVRAEKLARFCTAVDVAGPPPARSWHSP